MNIDAADSAVIAEARQRLKQCRLSGVPCCTRQQAQAILLGLTPPPPKQRRQPKPYTTCTRCGQLIRKGDIVHATFDEHLGECPIFRDAVAAVAAHY